MSQKDCLRKGGGFLVGTGVFNVNSQEYDMATIDASCVSDDHTGTSLTVGTAPPAITIFLSLR